jgi:hypothetical protein
MASSLILSGEGLYEEQGRIAAGITSLRSCSDKPPEALWFITVNTRCVKDGAEPKKKREGSAKP